MKNDGAALHEAYHLGEALALLDKHADRYHWYMAKGRTRPTEPLYAVGLSKVLPNGVTEADFLVIAEGNDLVSCVHECLAKVLHHTQEAGTMTENQRASTNVWRRSYTTHKRPGR